MSTVSDNRPTSSSTAATTTDETAPPPTRSVTSIAPLISDPERQQRLAARRRRKEPTFLTRLANAFLSPFNMWAPLPDYGLEERLSNHPDERIHHDLYNILIGAQDVRTQQWRMAYWSVLVSTWISWLYAVRERFAQADPIARKGSLVCTLGTAFIGTANTIVTFNNNPLAQKVLSIFLAVFGVVLSLLKGSLFASMLLTSSSIRLSIPTLHPIGTGMPVNAFMSVNRANDIIVRRFHIAILSQNTISTFRVIGYY